MTKISDTQRKALDTIRSGRVFMLNDGSTDTKGVTSATVKALRKSGLIVPNGASRTMVKGRAARRLTLTPAGISA
jgi:hypothetical protein